MNRNSLRIATAIFALTALAGCGALQETGLFSQDFWTINVAQNNVQAELGLAELAKGNNVEAQGHFETALKANPNDALALYGLAVLYQNTGQPMRARQLYEAILALDPKPQDELLVWADKQTQPVVDLANVNLHLMNSAAGAPMPGTAMMEMPEPGGSMSQMPLSMTPPMTSSSMGVPSPTRRAYGAPGMGAGMEQMFKDEDLNIVARFQTLRALLDQGLITQDEFVVRRRVNVGALLPLSSSPPATGLDRPVPSAEQVSSRLRAIGRALEMRALSPAQHSAERSMILDALMPAAPVSLETGAIAPRGLMEAADSVRRLELLQASDLITSDEYAKERAAIEAAMQPVAPKPGGAAMSTDAVQKIEPEKPKLSGFQPAVHLASYRQQRAAERGWAALKKRFASQLGRLEHRIERVDLGGGKGVFYRLKAGPLPSNNAAQSLCRELKAKRQYCDPSTINFG